MEANYILHTVNQINKEKTKSAEQNEIKRKMGDFCIDVAKYVLTGVFFATIFSLIENVMWLIIVCSLLIMTFISFGIVLLKKK